MSKFTESFDRNFEELNTFYLDLAQDALKDNDMIEYLRTRACHALAFVLLYLVIGAAVSAAVEQVLDLKSKKPKP